MVASQGRGQTRAHVYKAHLLQLRRNERKLAHGAGMELWSRERLVQRDWGLAQWGSISPDERLLGSCQGQLGDRSTPAEPDLSAR